ncbi:MAG: biotin--[acetyl-CoA-carboxylase] ligase [Prevotella sp.]|jgi:BirA family biotin operon repressor/biotin-[acetyl-CoA-carboxylase] ligase|nr:biotin--[acetyl-CoA-carboxylase] ligase [Prevotella sp.]
MPPIIHIQETDSTSNYLKRLLHTENVEEGTIVFADYQSSGKGQRGNAWESEKGKNLLFSIVLYPPVKANEQFVISQIISLAVSDLLKEYTNDISIKWPNDIYWKEKKICGILVENTLIGEYIKESVCGIGININQETFVSNAPNPVSLQQIANKEFDLLELLNQAKDKIGYYYNKLISGEIALIKNQYESSLFRKDGYYQYNDGKHVFSARIIDIETNGLLVLQDKNGEIRKFAFKEIKYIL